MKHTFSLPRDGSLLRLPNLSLLALLLVVAFSAGMEPLGISAEAAISFNNQVQPVLSEYCYPCHGPDSSTRKPKKNPLRLDREQFAVAPRDDGKPVINRTEPKSSELLRRIKATDDDVMPPLSQPKRPKPEEIALLERWVLEGAKYEKHWSLIPPVKAAAPVVKKRWVKNPTDSFVAAKLRENGLKPNAQEHPARLFRRLSFDLTGLPPAPEELQAFLRQKSPGAYEAAVDKMLCTDASAEHFTRY